MKNKYWKLREIYQSDSVGAMNIDSPDIMTGLNVHLIINEQHKVFTLSNCDCDVAKIGYHWIIWYHSHQPITKFQSQSQKWVLSCDRNLLSENEPLNFKTKSLSLLNEIHFVWNILKFYFVRPLNLLIKYRCNCVK